MESGMELGPLLPFSLILLAWWVFKALKSLRQERMTEKAFLKQPKVFICSKKSGKGKRPGKGGNRFWKNVGLGFKTPREAIEGDCGQRCSSSTDNSGCRCNYPVHSTKLVNLYSVCDSLSTAHLLFDRIPKDNLFLWNVLIRGYAWNGPQQVALSLYYQMLDYGLQPDNFTFPFVLKACSTLSALQEGRDIHQHVIRTKWESDVFVGAALIDMYAKCGCFETSRQVFDKIIVRDVVLWNSMLAAYSHNGHPDEALSLCREMALAGLRLTVATLVSTL
ncbi:hypothetical protein HHK36_001516 [Tetracentron sinense]|uniref:Small ribosomal subunit protein uS17 N-terminal domain-containing protein n=1 Tax=Tetracentron sinense TaxID=13715 RepID=A0A834ZTK9_TETSI|nr:hypothetical protein HHK36_001516 [Tetracentron sinense]